MFDRYKGVELPVCELLDKHSPAFQQILIDGLTGVLEIDEMPLARSLSEQDEWVVIAVSERTKPEVHVSSAQVVSSGFIIGESVPNHPK